MVLVEAASHVFFLKKSFFLFSPLTGKRKKTSKIFELNTVQNGVALCGNLEVDAPVGVTF